MFKSLTKPKKEQYYRIPFDKVWQLLPDGRLRLIPRRITVDGNTFEVEKGELTLSPARGIKKADSLFRIRWHDHIGKDLAGKFIYSDDLKDYVEIFGFITK
jgi:hypothetical protein